MKFFLLVLFQTAIAAPTSEGIKLQAHGGSVSFLAVGRPSMLKIHGKAPGPVGEFTLQKNGLSGKAKFSLDSLETGIKLRDQHMKEKYLVTAEHPEAELVLTKAEIGADFANTLSVTEPKPFEGNLRLHGKESPIKGTFTSKNGMIEAKFPLTLTEFGIAVPSYLGVTVAETVDVSVATELKKQ